ncbi:MAG TPA: hypothetical protein VJH92_04705 [Candidatus Nanoarchaeia archaeon]|nr:hypothetical protein [Candidatus Nanoarchaeia archaeon]
MDEKNHEVKKGLHVYWYYWSVFAAACLFAINYYSRNIRVDALDVGLMISTVSFLFGFLITIIFSMIINKMSSLKAALATETGRLTSLYLLSEHLGEKFHKLIAERIDSYAIKTLRDYTSYEVGREEIYKIHRDLPSIELKNEIHKQVSNSFLYILGEMQPIREQLEYLTSRKVEWPLKFSTYVLGGILISLLFLNRGDSFTNVIFIILSTTIIFIFLIIEDYDNLRIGDYSYNISNSEQLFDLIGKERYYPSQTLNRAKLEEGKKYRIGFYDAKSGEEKIMFLTYSAGFKFKIHNLALKFKKKV